MKTTPTANVKREKNVSVGKMCGAQACFQIPSAFYYLFQATEMSSGNVKSSKTYKNDKICNIHRYCGACNLRFLFCLLVYTVEKTVWS